MRTASFDFERDRAAAAAAGVPFALAGWNARARPEPGGLVMCHPSDLRDLLARGHSIDHDTN
ncbi:MAG: hypothetical protein WD691_05720 [Acidimicrobiales bacterium]